MSISPENYIKLEKECIKLESDMELVFKDFETDTEYDYTSFAETVYNKMVELEGKLPLFIKNAKIHSIAKKYQGHLDKIKSNHENIRMIALII